jgi:hypothetical protein
MGMYPGPNCPNRPSLEELSTVEVDARIHKVLDLGVSPNPRVGPIPLRRGIASARVSTLGPVWVAFMILSSHGAHDFALGPRGSRDVSREATSPEDAAMWEAKRTPSEEMWVRREREIGVPPDLDPPGFRIPVIEGPSVSFL